MIFALANLTLGPLSLTIAENFCGPTLSKTSFILVAKKFPVWDSFEKSDSRYRYSFRSGVIIKKFQYEWFLPLFHPSKAF